MWKTLLVCEVVLVSAQQGVGPCRMLHDIMEDFDLDRYTGVWYTLLGWSNSQEADVRGKCSKETINIKDKNIIFKEESISDRYGFQTSSHQALQDEPNEAKFTLSMFDVVKVPYWVVDTDYKHWAVVYSCTGDQTHYLKSLLVLGRDRKVSNLWNIPEAKKGIRRAMRRSNLLKLRDLTRIDQTDCVN